MKNQAEMLVGSQSMSHYHSQNRWKICIQQNLAYQFRMNAVLVTQLRGASDSNIKGRMP